MKMMRSFVAATLLLALVGQAGADTVFSGDTFAWFGTPSGSPVYTVDNGSYPVDMSSTLLSGAPAVAEGGSQNEYTMTGELAFSALENKPFAVADLFYHNGRTVVGTCVTSVPVNVDVYFTNPAGVDRTFTFDFEFLLTVNTDDPVASADKLTPVDVFSTTTFPHDGEQYTLELLGFSNDGGITLEKEFILFEETDTTSTLYGRIVPPGRPTPGGEEVVPEPTGLGLLAAALLGIRRKRRS